MYDNISSCVFLYFLRFNFWTWCSAWCSDFKGWCKRCLPFVSYVYRKLKHNRDKTNKSFANPALTHYHLLSCFDVQPFPGAKPQRNQLVATIVVATMVATFDLAMKLSMRDDLGKMIYHIWSMLDNLRYIISAARLCEIIWASMKGVCQRWNHLWSEDLPWTISLRWYFIDHPAYIPSHRDDSMDDSHQSTNPLLDFFRFSHQISLTPSLLVNNYFWLTENVYAKSYINQIQNFCTEIEMNALNLVWIEFFVL